MYQSFKAFGELNAPLVVPVNHEFSDNYFLPVRWRLLSSRPYVGICGCRYVGTRFLVLLTVLLAFAFAATLAPALALLAITLAVVAMLAFTLFLAVKIASAVATMLACIPGIALIYGRRFVDTRSPGITAVASGRHIGMRFPGIACRFVSCGYYVGICSRHYVCIRSPGIDG